MNQHLQSKNRWPNLLLKRQVQVSGKSVVNGFQIANLPSHSKTTSERSCKFPQKIPEYLLEPDVVGKIRDLDLEAEAENKILSSILSEALEESTKVLPFFLVVT